MDLLAPLVHSHTANELEEALQSIYSKTFLELFEEDLKSLFDYSVPHMAGPSVVERFTKQDGLVVLRRPGTSEAIMRVIYANWKALGSKRGLAFLEFVLKMIWPGQYKLRRLYHSKVYASSYPARLTYTQSSDTFLTSRLHVSMSPDIDLEELAELAPTLAKLVPANLVPSVAIELEVNDIELKLAAGVQPALIGNFEPEEW
ncbi:hypothetical protein ACE5JW_11805 [Acinetobacter radioresistens]|jgi:hypothetical protein|uniref:hypothetical protein n=1 Tax=Acinetobacter radioresistens TaxID=40216 RepID=UPI0002CEBF09|nr:hypothetical protein [Acinetobacter radioresistens]ENV88218.1 hypothetical protein F940_00064 [Acinetobacter radioresistens NIPH 2130]MCK4078628.1 hypothetical protein [Acinetobacter radioresistens]MCK4084918.1 hypothetical protein [Acinetobacter radioresistens]MCK4097310.1 hypothetical protein [Acinetobacter radioresistens]MCK4115014.1 hypothetical protein [Acinetobacter radioresistens]